eukprot:m.128692 g.128692  ORF g.128692 m.128692 type:complete len:2513 (+) comp14564_c0_seq1:55-7593(+)
MLILSIILISSLVAGSTGINNVQRLPRKDTGSCQLYGCDNPSEAGQDCSCRSNCAGEGNCCADYVVTCGATAPPDTPTPDMDVCQDYVNLGFCYSEPTYMNTNCSGYCVTQPPASTTSEGLTEVDWCAYYANLGYCDPNSQYYSYMISSCAPYCQPTTVTSTEAIAFVDAGCPTDPLEHFYRQFRLKDWDEGSRLLGYFVDTQTADECAELCIQTAGCLAFGYRPNNFKCDLKSLTIPDVVRLPNDHWNYYYRIVQPCTSSTTETSTTTTEGCPADPTLRFANQSGTRDSGHRIRIFDTTDPDGLTECANACAAEPTCMAFNFRVDKGKCDLKWDVYEEGDENAMEVWDYYRLIPKCGGVFQGTMITDTTTAGLTETSKTTISTVTDTTVTSATDTTSTISTETSVSDTVVTDTSITTATETTMTVTSVTTVTGTTETVTSVTGSSVTTATETMTTITRTTKTMTAVTETSATTVSGTSITSATGTDTTSVTGTTKTETMTSGEPAFSSDVCTGGALYNFGEPQLELRAKSKFTLSNIGPVTMEECAQECLNNGINCTGFSYATNQDKCWTTTDVSDITIPNNLLWQVRARLFQCRTFIATTVTSISSVTKTTVTETETSTTETTSSDTTTTTASTTRTKTSETGTTVTTNTETTKTDTSFTTITSVTNTDTDTTATSITQSSVTTATGTTGTITTITGTTITSPTSVTSNTGTTETKTSSVTGTSKTMTTETDTSITSVTSITDTTVTGTTNTFTSTTTETDTSATSVTSVTTITGTTNTGTTDTVTSVTTATDTTGTSITSITSVTDTTITGSSNTVTTTETDTSVTSVTSATTITGTTNTGTTKTVTSITTGTDTSITSVTSVTTITGTSNTVTSVTTATDTTVTSMTSITDTTITDTTNTVTSITTGTETTETKTTSATETSVTETGTSKTTISNTVTSTTKSATTETTNTKTTMTVTSVTGTSITTQTTNTDSTVSDTTNTKTTKTTTTDTTVSTVTTVSQTTTDTTMTRTTTSATDTTSTVTTNTDTSVSNTVTSATSVTETKTKTSVSVTSATTSTETTVTDTKTSVTYTGSPTTTTPTVSSTTSETATTASETSATETSGTTVSGTDTTITATTVTTMTDTTVTDTTITTVTDTTVTDTTVTDTTMTSVTDTNTEKSTITETTSQTTETTETENLSCSINDMQVKLVASEITIQTSPAIFGAMTSMPTRFTDSVIADPRDACGTVNQRPGSLILIERGNCSFALKAKNAQDAGASVIVIGNVVGMPEFGAMGCLEEDTTLCESIVIPVVFVSFNDSVLIQNAITNGEIINVDCQQSRVPPESTLTDTSSTMTTNTGTTMSSSTDSSSTATTMTNTQTDTTVSHTIMQALSSSSVLTCEILTWGFQADNNIVCGASIVQGKCHKNTSKFIEAASLCLSEGARLCSLEELRANAVASTGCGIDKSLVWSRTPCGNSSRSFHRASGSRIGGEIDCAPVDGEELASVRCCADSGLDPTTPAPQTIPPTIVPQIISVESCTELDWKRKADNKICGFSKINGSCHKTENFLAALEICETAGSRLCTAEELRNNYAASTGCGLDKMLVWTSTKCNDTEGMYLTVSGSKSYALEECPLSPVTSKAAVRCCADEPDTTLPPISMPEESAKSCLSLGWKHNSKFSPPTVCAESNLGFGCEKNVTYLEAAHMCVNAGARLCTAHELENSAAASTGCGFDNSLVWSSTTCEGFGFTMVSGSPRGGEKRCASIESETAAVRCCADGTADGLPFTTTPPATTIPKSQKSCEDLAWGFFEASSRVCGFSRADNKCHKDDLTYEEGAAICSNAGARLCTATELQENAAASTGCGIDTSLVWTSIPCEGGMLVTGGSKRNTNAECRSVVEPASLRCCADSEPTLPEIPSISSTPCDELGWEFKFGSVNVCAKSKAVSSCLSEVNFIEALTECQSAGGRLCTLEEVGSNFAAGTGCGLDRSSIWTSTPCGQDNKGIIVTGGSAGKGIPTQCLDPFNSVAGMRCCADSIVPPTIDFSSSSPAVFRGGEEGLSGSSCRDLAWTFKGNNVNICSSSEISGSCHAESNYLSASALCASQGARLCSTEELADGAAIGSGCSFDFERVWTRTACESGHVSRMGDGRAAMNDGSSAAECTPNSELRAVRCCADSALTFISEHDLAQEVSSLTCDELGWDYKYGNGEVCGATEIPSCSQAKSHTEATEQCSAMGSRLCTIHEVEQHSVRGTGCGVDKSHIWTNSKCSTSEGDGHYITLGDGRTTTQDGAAAAVCVTNNSDNQVAVRCCADRIVPVQPTCTFVPDVDYWRRDLPDGKHETNNKEECRDLCLAREDCSFFTFKGGFCYLKHSNVGQRDAPGITSGYCIRERQRSRRGNNQRKNKLAVVNPSPLHLSQKNCLQLGWAQVSTMGVCASKRIHESEQQCMRKSVTFAQAVTLCQSIGARLCSLDETRNIHSVNANSIDGCDVSRQSTWTRTQCSSGFLVHRATEKPMCVPSSSRRKLQCCADVTL